MAELKSNILKRDAIADWNNGDCALPDNYEA